MAKADLHVHTTQSDGSDCMESILRKGKRLGLTHIAFSNHDTTKGAMESVEMAKGYGIKSIPAVEMSAIDTNTGLKAHILGYGFSRCKAIDEIGSETLRKRNDNCLKQMEQLEGLGYHLDLRAIQKLGGGCIYKQHILDYLVTTGQEEQMFGSVYRSIFKNGGPCDFDIDYPDVRMVIKAIIEDGGYPVLAHVGQQNNFALIPGLVKEGLKGLERNHPSHNERHLGHIDSLSKGYGLFTTGGSDYHGRYEQTPSVLGSHVVHVMPEI